MPKKKVKKKEVERCFTCPLCTNLFDRATTISECLHTFCRNCIHDKLITERLKACPICNVDLGGAPLDKLRSDYSLEDMKLKLFPPKTETVKAGPKTVAASLQSSKKKEKSLTSLMASSSRVSFSSDLNQDATVEPNVLLKEKLSKQEEEVPRVHSSDKPIITFKKREKKTSIRKKNESKQPDKEAEVKKFTFDLNNEPDNGLDEAEASISQDVIAKEKDHEAIPVSSDLCKSLSDAKEFAPLNINETLAVNVEPKITSNGRENQDYVPISSDDTEGSVEPIDNNCVVNRETEEVPVQVNQNTVLISSDRDTTEEVSDVKLKNNGKEKQECATRKSRNRSRKKKVVEKSYSLRPRSAGRAMNPAASTPQVAKSVEADSSLRPPMGGVMMNPAASTAQVAKSVEADNSLRPPMGGIMMNPAASTPQVAKSVEADNSLRSRSGGRAINPAASTPQVAKSKEAETKVEGRNNPVWFTLLASRNKKTVGLLPQISPRYLKVKNRNMTVSYVKKYLVHKLSLGSEDQVEIWLRHEPVSSSETLHNLVDWWVQTTPLRERKSAMVGGSGAEFVMVLYYSLKATSELSGSD